MPWSTEPSGVKATKNESAALEQSSQVQKIRSQLQRHAAQSLTLEDYHHTNTTRRHVAAMCLTGLRRETVAAVPQRMNGVSPQTTYSNMQPTPLVTTAKSVFEV